MAEETGEPRGILGGHGDRAKLHIEPGILRRVRLLVARDMKSKQNERKHLWVFRRHVIYLHKDLQYKSEVPNDQIALQNIKLHPQPSAKILMQRS